MGYNVPDDWGCYYRKCGQCGGTYHMSEGGCACEADAAQEAYEEDHNVCRAALMRALVLHPDTFDVPGADLADFLLGCLDALAQTGKGSVGDYLDRVRPHVDNILRLRDTMPPGPVEDDLPF